MISPSSHNAQSTSSFTEEVTLIPRWSIAAAALAFVFMQYFFWVILPAYRLKPSTAPFGLRLYFALSWKHFGGALYADGGLRKPRCAATRHEHALVGAHLPGTAGRNRSSALFSAAPTSGCALPFVWDQYSHRVPFLSSMRLPGLCLLRQLLSRRAYYRRLLRLLWP